MVSAGSLRASVRRFFDENTDEKFWLLARAVALRWKVSVTQNNNLSRDPASRTGTSYQWVTKLWCNGPNKTTLSLDHHWRHCTFRGAVHSTSNGWPTYSWVIKCFCPSDTLLGIFPMYWDSNVTNCQVKKLIYLHPAGERLDTQRLWTQWQVKYEPMPCPQHLSNSGPTYSRVTKCFGPIHELLSTYPVYRDTNHTSCQVNNIISLQPVGEILWICGVDNVQETVEDLEADEQLLAHTPHIVEHIPSTAWNRETLQEWIPQACGWAISRQTVVLEPCAHPDQETCLAGVKTEHTILGCSFQPVS